jgi:TolA-binding protein
MRGSISVVGAGVCALMLSGCAGTGALEAELSRLRRDQHSMAESLAETRRALERLESRVTLLSLGEKVSAAPRTPVAQAEQTEPASPAAGARPASRVLAKDEARAVLPRSRSEKVLPVVRLAAQADPAAARGDDWVDPGAVDDGGPPVVLDVSAVRSAEGQGETLPVDREVLKKADPLAAARAGKRPSRAEVAAAHERAVAMVRDRQRPAEALPLLTDFLAAHPDSEQAGSAGYWLAECHARLGAHAPALDAFRAVLRAHPQGAKTPNVLLGIGEAELALGRVAEGRASLGQLIDLFPATEAAQLARARLAALPEGGR